MSIISQDTEDLEIIVNNELIEPIGTITLERGMKRKASTLRISFKKEDGKSFELGQMVTLKYKDVKAFKGYIFGIDETEGDLIKVLAYDQMRYLKNQHTMLIKNKTASKLIKEIASIFRLKVGAIEDTKVDIATKQVIVENKSLMDIIYEALENTMLANKQAGRLQQYILYDDYGELKLAKLNDLKTDLLIDGESILKYSYSQNIDGETYNKILIYYKDDKDHKINNFITENSTLEDKWGVLQKTVSTQRITESQASKYGADLLKYYSVPKKSFRISTVVTDINIRGGTKIAVTLDDKAQNYFIVDTVTHKFTNNEYTMDMVLLGVDY